MLSEKNCKQVKNQTLINLGHVPFYEFQTETVSNSD